MLLEVFIGGALAYLAAKNMIQVRVQVKPYSIAETIDRVRKCAIILAEEVRVHLMNKAARQKAQAQQRAQALYDATVGDIFQNATEEEKEMLLGLFRKYMPSDR